MTLPFVGRQDELQQLESVLRDQQDGVWVALSVPAGGGKSRLARELAHQMGLKLLETRGVDLESPQNFREINRLGADWVAVDPARPCPWT